MSNKIFGERIKELRTKLKLTQRQMADELDITSASLSSYEVGGKSPTVSGAIAIATKYNVSLDWLFGLEKDDIESITTYDEVIRFLLSINKKIPISIQGENGGAPWKIVLQSQKMNEFLQEWSKMQRLLSKKTIDSELYEFWIQKQLEKHDEEINDFDTIFPF